MKKLALNLDELEVTSFEVTSPDTDERGTVNGQALPATPEILRDYLSFFIC